MCVYKHVVVFVCVCAYVCTVNPTYNKVGIPRASSLLYKKLSRHQFSTQNGMYVCIGCGICLYVSGQVLLCV